MYTLNITHDLPSTTSVSRQPLGVHFFNIFSDKTTKVCSSPQPELSARAWCFQRLCVNQWSLPRRGRHWSALQSAPCSSPVYLFRLRLAFFSSWSDWIHCSSPGWRDGQGLLRPEYSLRCEDATRVRDTWGIGERRAEDESGTEQLGVHTSHTLHDPFL